MIARHAERLQSFADATPGTVAYPADITDLDGYRETLRRIVKDHGYPKMVVYNASLATLVPYTELEPELLERNFRANTSGLLVTVQELAAAMAEGDGGSIVVTGNTGALRGTASFIGFSPTKASQRILAESLARELGPQGVHVAYVIIDALIDMPMVRRRFTDKPDEFFSKPDDIADEVYGVAHQPRSAWSFLSVIRPFGENW